MDNATYWLTIFKYIAICFCVVVVSVIGSCQASKYQIRKAIEAGVSPMNAACAFDHGNIDSDTLCAITLLKNHK